MKRRQKHTHTHTSNSGNNNSNTIINFVICNRCNVRYAFASPPSVVGDVKQWWHFFHSFHIHHIAALSIDGVCLFSLYCAFPTDSNSHKIVDVGLSEWTIDDIRTMANGDNALYIINVNISLNNMIEGFYLLLWHSPTFQLFLFSFLFSSLNSRLWNTNERSAFGWVDKVMQPSSLIGRRRRIHKYSKMEIWNFSIKFRGRSLTLYPYLFAYITAQAENCEIGPSLAGESGGRCTDKICITGICIRTQ